MLSVVREPPVLPQGASITSAGPRRPGELHERLWLSTELDSSLRAGAAEAGVAVSTTAAILIEFALLSADLRGLALDPETLNSAAVRCKIARRLSAAEADYLRLLSARRWSRPDEGPITAPVRLLGRLPLLDLGKSLDLERLDRALQWEIAALAEGRTMTEWGLHAALQRLL